MDDIIIIGSGFGGAVAAHELTLAGARVRLIERGPWRDTAPMRTAGIKARAPLPHGRHFFTHILFRAHHRRLPARGLRWNRHGMFEFFAGDGIGALCSSGVGGGSHAYGGLLARPLRPDYWDGHVDEIDSVSMEKHYQALFRLFDPAPPLPPRGHDIALRGDSAFIELTPQEQPRWAYRPVEGNEVDFTSEGLLGSPKGAKLTLDAACLVPAMSRGLEIESGHEVQVVEALPGRGYAVHGIDLNSGQPQNWQARRVIVAAGTLNSVKILLRSCRAGTLPAMPALGLGLSGNGDDVAPWPVRLRDADLGRAGVYSRIFRHHNDELGPIVMQICMRGGFDGGAIPLPGFLRRRIDRMQGIGTMGCDAANGTIDLSDERLILSYDRAANPIFEQIDRIHDELERLSGVRPQAGKIPMTVHPLGGARLGQNSAHSVINGDGQAHGLPGLYVADGSALPAAPGSPPSITIAAWSRHVAHALLRE